MFYAISWTVTLLLLAVWSLTAWALQVVGTWVLSNTGALTDATRSWSDFGLPGWLQPWVPQELLEGLTSVLLGLGGAVEGLLQFAPALAGGLSVAIWVVWGVGSLLLLLLGLAAHLLIGYGLRQSRQAAMPRVLPLPR